MPPTIPESDFEVVEGTNYEASNIKKYVYNIKFEVVMKEGTKMIPGKASLTKAMMTIKNAKRKTDKIDFFDTNGFQISPDLRGIDQDEIEGRFCMEVGGIDDNHLFFACTIQTTIAFSIIKGRTIDEFKKHNIYIKIHKGGYKYGVNWSPIGFFLKQHPGFTDTVAARDKLMKTITNSWYQDKVFFDNEQKTKIAKVIDPEAHSESFDPLAIPFEIIQSSISAKNSDNEVIRANAVIVTIPYQFFKVGITMMDYLAITTDTIDNYIPIGYKKEEPDNFFNIVYEHVKWLENVRHVSITNIPTYRQFQEETDENGKTLDMMLQQIKHIDHFGYIRSKKTVQVAVHITKVQSTIDRIQEAISESKFSYNPQVAKKFNPSGSLGSSKSGTSKYSAAMAKYQTNRSPNASIATSHGEDISRLTGTTGRSWGNSRKIPKEIDFTDATEFPPIQTNHHKPNNEQHTHRANPTTLDDSITDTTVIQQAIDSALKKAYEEHNKELIKIQERFNQQLEIIRNQQTNSTLERKVDRLMEIILMDKQAALERESPIRKKGRPNNLEQTAFATNATPTRSNCNTKGSDDDTNMIDQNTDPEPPMGPHFHFASTTEHETRTNNQDEASHTSSDSSENEWITKKKKEKKFPKMTQTKIVDMMMHGGYGQSTSSPSRKHNTTHPPHTLKQTPPRPGRGSPPRMNRSDKPNSNELRLTKLSSSRGGHKEPHGSEN
jgi:hypothetical protein